MIEITNRLNLRTGAKRWGILGLALAISAVVCLGCEKGDTTGTTGGEVLNAALVDAACGQCMFDMAGDGCQLAVRHRGKLYFVDGTSIDDHGDAHAADGLCSKIRHARLSGEIADGRVNANSFELLASMGE